jgi:hypothetical protein
VFGFGFEFVFGFKFVFSFALTGPPLFGTGYAGYRH